jgi:hypothetical protein
MAVPLVTGMRYGAKLQGGGRGHGNRHADGDDPPIGSLWGRVKLARSDPILRLGKPHHAGPIPSCPELGRVDTLRAANRQWACEA